MTSFFITSQTIQLSKSQRVPSVGVHIASTVTVHFRKGVLRKEATSQLHSSAGKQGTTASLPCSLNLMADIGKVASCEGNSERISRKREFREIRTVTNTPVFAKWRQFARAPFFFFFFFPSNFLSLSFFPRLLPPGPVSTVFCNTLLLHGMILPSPKIMGAPP